MVKPKNVRIRESRLSGSLSPGVPISPRTRTIDAELEELQHVSFNYFLHETNPVNELVIDKTEADWPASIAATGLALASYPVTVAAAAICGPNR